MVFKFIPWGLGAAAVDSAIVLFRVGASSTWNIPYFIA